MLERFAVSSNTMLGTNNRVVKMRPNPKKDVCHTHDQPPKECLCSSVVGTSDRSDLEGHGSGFRGESTFVLSLCSWPTEYSYLYLSLYHQQIHWLIRCVVNSSRIYKMKERSLKAPSIGYRPSTMKKKPSKLTRRQGYEERYWNLQISSVPRSAEQGVQVWNGTCS